MPTITFAFDDLCRLVGQKLDDKKLIYLLDCAKAELEAKLTGEMSVKYNDTNQPYLWSVEGLARLFRGILGREKGVPKVKTEKILSKVIVDKRLSKVRPYIACFAATGIKIDDYLLKQLIQLQEKLAENFGRKRQKISIGLYPLQKISFPLYFKGVLPSEKFTPLDFHEPVTLRQALERHPKGREYGHLIEHSSVFPVLADSRKEILSLAPVINSEQTGRVKVGDDSILFDTTGMDEDSVNLVANIFAYALSDRGFKIWPLTIEYGAKKIVTPAFDVHRIKLKESDVEKLLGVKLKQSEIKNCLERMRYDYSAGMVTIPSYRNDIMHNVDVIEDISIMYGYDNFESMPLTSYTIGRPLPVQHFIDIWRDLWTGLEYQEVMSAVLSNKELLYDKMNVSDFGTVEILNIVSKTYDCVRSWILPIMMDVLSKNKHVDYPQKVFEQGLVSIRDKDGVRDEEHFSAVSCHASATFTEMKQRVDHVLRMSQLSYQIQECNLACFVPGRAAEVVVNKKRVGFFGEIHPAVLDKFGLLLPAAACEINLSALFAEKK